MELCLCRYPPPSPKVKHDLISNDLQVYKLTIVTKFYTAMKLLSSVYRIGIKEWTNTKPKSSEDATILKGVIVNSKSVCEEQNVLK